jgi:two-component system nitrate/nitrite response regulator NarL
VTGLRVALVEDHDMFAETLDIALTIHRHDVVRVPLPDRACSVESLVAPVLAVRPDVALLDLDLGIPGSATRIVEPLTQAKVAVVVITGSTELARWGECLHRGARRVMPKTVPLQDVVSTLRRIDTGLPVIARERREALISVWRREEAAQRLARERLESLTNREQAILGHLVSGRQVRDIARADVVSEATVRSQVKSILMKLGVASQLAAVGLAHRIDWRGPELERAGA